MRILVWSVLSVLVLSLAESGRVVFWSCLLTRFKDPWNSSPRGKHACAFYILLLCPVRVCRTWGNPRLLLILSYLVLRSLSKHPVKTLKLPCFRKPPPPRMTYSAFRQAWLNVSHGTAVGIGILTYDGTTRILPPTLNRHIPCLFLLIKSDDGSNKLWRRRGIRRGNTIHYFCLWYTYIRLSRMDETKNLQDYTRKHIIFFNFVFCFMWKN
jgi:hypothetical protein